MRNFISQIDIMNVTWQTWVRAVQMIISILAMIFKYFGIIIPDIDENLILNIIIIAFTIISFLQCFWKNNSFTQSAQVADIYMHKAKEDAKREN